MKSKFILLLILFPFWTNAQICKGDYFLQAEVQSDSKITSNTTSSPDIRFPTFKLSVGKFVNEKNALGIQILGSYRGSEPYTFGVKNYSYGLGILHWYVIPFSKRWGIGLKSECNYRRGRLGLDDINAYVATLQEFKLLTSPGVYGFLYSKLALNASFELFSLSNIQHTNDKGLTPINQLKEYNSFYINANLPQAFGAVNFQLALIYFFNHK